jgi:hypothetical protein
LRCNNARSQGEAWRDEAWRAAPRRVCQIVAVAPTTKRLRSIGSPARVMRPGRALPAVE